MKSNESTKKPWINDDGSEKTTGEIKKMSKKWTQEDWEEYLSDQESSLRESYLDDPTLYERNLSAENYAGLIFGIAEYSTMGRVAINVTLAQLTKQQNDVLRLTFWEGMTQRGIEKELGITRASVRYALSTGLQKIKKIIESGELIEKIGALKSMYIPTEIAPKLLPKILRPETYKNNNPKLAQTTQGDISRR